MDQIIALEQYRTQHNGSLDYTLTDEGCDAIDNALATLIDGNTLVFTFANEAVTVHRSQAYVVYPGLCTEQTITSLSQAKREVYWECRNMVHQVSCRQEGRRH